LTSPKISLLLYALIIFSLALPVAVSAFEYPAEGFGPYSVNWLNGTDAPGAGLGFNGDYYLQLNGNVYHKASDAWTLITSIAGPANMTAGPEGPPGPMNQTVNMTSGPQGPQGEQGIPGAANMTMNMTAGEAATIDVNYTFTGAPGTDASVVNIGTTQDALLDFTIPEGVNGTSGEGSSYNSSYEILQNHTSFYANKSYEDSRPVINTSYLTVAINNSYEVLQNHSSFYANKSYEDSRAVINASYDTITNVSSHKVEGAASSTNNDIVVFSGTTGKAVADSGTLVSALETISNNSAHNSTIWSNLSTTWTSLVGKDTIVNVSAANSTIWTNLSTKETITNTSSQNATLWNRLKQRANISIFAGSMVPTNTGGATVVAPNSTGLNNLTWTHIDVPNGSRTNISFPYIMPADYDSGTLTYQYWWTYSGGTVSTTLSMNLNGWCGGDNTALSTIPGTAIMLNDTAQTALAIHISPVSNPLTLGGTPAPNNLCWFTFYRNGGSLATSGHVIALRIGYNVN
jgi:hypothetical protein